MKAASQEGYDDEHDRPLRQRGEQLQQCMEDAVNEARNILIAAGVDAAIIAVTATGEDAITRTRCSGYGNWHTQTGLIQHLYEKRKQAPRNEQFFDDKRADEADGE